ncbi:hypothetical protein PV11_02371 [Exophiala sideris]|uniref:Uncharacterized protein n=1 Tax=Exophiala sideris TaxID=1016849 RepID=A0A0D1YW33_9EURO|nr:hypothetical protein PV11_02371 [Exophiala sideris]
MQALVYKGEGQLALEDHPVPQLKEPTDAIVKGVFSSLRKYDSPLTPSSHLHHDLWDRPAHYARRRSNRHARPDLRS